MTTKKKVKELIKDFKKEATDEFMSNVDELNELVQCFFENDFLDGEPVMEKIKKLMLVRY